MTERQFVAAYGCDCRICEEAREAGGPTRTDAALAFEDELQETITRLPAVGRSAHEIIEIALGLVRSAHWRREHIRVLYDKVDAPIHGKT